MKNTTKTLLTIGAVAGFSFTTAQAATTFTGGGGDFDNAAAWDNGTPSSSNDGTVNTSASGLARATANFGGGWTIDHTGGDLQFDGGWNVNGFGVGGTYNLSGGSIQVTGTGGGDDQNFQTNSIDFNLSNGSVSALGTFQINNNGALNFLAGSGTFDIGSWAGNKNGSMSFVSGWTGSATVTGFSGTDWFDALTSDLTLGSTVDGVTVTAVNFDDYFVVTGGNVLTLAVVPEPSSTALLGLGLSSLLLRRKRS